MSFGAGGRNPFGRLRAGLPTRPQGKGDFECETGYSRKAIDFIYIAARVFSPAEMSPRKRARYLQCMRMGISGRSSNVAQESVHDFQKELYLLEIPLG